MNGIDTGELGYIITVTSPGMDTIKNIEHSLGLGGCAPIGRNPWKERRKEWKIKRGWGENVEHEVKLYFAMFIK